MAARIVVDGFYVKLLPWNYNSLTTNEERHKACEALALNLTSKYVPARISLEYEKHFECEFCGGFLMEKDVICYCGEAQEEYFRNVDQVHRP